MTDNKKLFFSNDTGRTWIAQISNCSGRDIVFVDSWNGWLLADDAVYFTNSGGTATVNQKATNVLDNFVLFQNYPNPFNASTKIRYRVDKTAFVTLTVFDLNGRQIEALVSKIHPAGNYKLSWSADQMPSGTYLIQLKSDYAQQTRKLLLLR